MAEGAGDEAQEKSEEPSGKRVEEFRKEGKVVKSHEISSMVAVVSGLGALMILGPRLMSTLRASIEGAFLMRESLPEAASIWFHKFGMPVAEILLAFCAILFVSVFLASASQTGFLVAWKVLEPRLDRMNPLQGIKNIVSVQTLVQFTKNLLKTFIIGWIAYSELKDHVDELATVSVLSFVESFRWTIAILAKVTFRIAIFLGVLAVFDYLYQWYSLHKKMMMSRQELKEEIKQQELPEHVKTKVRRVARERSKRVIHKEVPQADVIVTNPTHYAIALRYNRSKESAPRVIAKGKDLMAKLIRDIATEHQVPFYEYPELARGLYRKVKVGQVVPVEFYESVAQVLAYIFRLYRRRHLVTGREGVY